MPRSGPVEKATETIFLRIFQYESMRLMLPSSLAFPASSPLFVLEKLLEILFARLLERGPSNPILETHDTVSVGSNDISLLGFF
jgi:hypothetical protein